MTANSTNSAPGSPGNFGPSGRVGGLKVGDTLDKFEIVEQIGSGGMSIVWKGYDALLNKHVAIKQLLPESADDEQLRQRFREEARLQKRVGQDHKHLVRVIDFVEEPRGLFLITEYVDGPSLEQVLAQTKGAVELRQAVGIVGATALALEAIHAAGVVHRDLKPSNILLPRAGGLKVGDFGIATLMAEQDTLSLGSVRYMAPELFTDGPVDGRADIYSLGVIAYEMLAGRPAFEDAFKIVLRDQRNQALRWMKWHTNPRAKAPPLTQLNPKVPAKLGELVARMMEKDTATRVATPRELLEAIRRNFASAEGGDAEVRGSQVDARPVGSSEKTAPLPKRSKLPYILMAVIVLQVLVGLGIWIYAKRDEGARAAELRGQARSHFERARDEYREAERAFINASANPDEARPQRDAAVERFRAARERFARLAEEWPNDRELGAGSAARVALSDSWIAEADGRYTEAGQAIDRAESLGVFDSDVIQGRRRQIANKAAFEKSIREIEGLVGRGEFGRARSLVLEAKEWTLTAEESARLDDLGARLEDQLARSQITAVIEQARQLERTNQRDRAIDVLSEASRRHRSGDVDALLKAMIAQRTHDQHAEAGQKAEAAGDLPGAVAAYSRALAAKPDAELATKTNVLRSRVALAEGRKLLGEGDAAEAREAFTRALGFHENAEARAELSRLDTSGQREAFVKAGDAAVAAGDLETAIKQFENANKLSTDAAVTAKLQASKLRFEVRRAQEAVEASDFDTARAAIARAQAIDADDPEAKQVLVRIEKQGEYHRLRAAGDELAKQSRFSEAKREYLRARDVLKTAEIQARIDETEYNQFLAQARQAIASQNWAGAQALLRTAASMRPTDEVRKLLEEVQSHLPKGEEE